MVFFFSLVAGCLLSAYAPPGHPGDSGSLRKFSNFGRLSVLAPFFSLGSEGLPGADPSQFAAGQYQSPAGPPIQQPASASDSSAESAGNSHLKKQPKRILGVMPNYRAVSAGEVPPPPTPRQAFKIATQNSFDYSSFVFVGITSAMAFSSDVHPKLGEGAAGYGRYYWRGFLDKTDGNYLVIFALPTILHQDERYFAKGEGGVWKRGIYAASRILITPNYSGHASVNLSELLGRGMAQGISTAYYPSADRTAEALATKYAYALGRDALTNVFREFWPDISAHLMHRRHETEP